MTQQLKVNTARVQCHYLSLGFPSNSAFAKKEGKIKILIQLRLSKNKAFLRQRCFSISMASSCCLQSMG